jgi:large subunit ribosomal protein L15
VTPELLKEVGLIRSTRKDVKILGHGDLKTNLTVVAHGVSASAREKIEAAGGTVTLLREPKAPKKESPRARSRRARAEKKDS